MNALFVNPPSTDGLGVKCYLVGYRAGGSQEVKIYDRAGAPSYPGSNRFMIRVTNRSGEHIETVYYRRAHNVRRWLKTVFHVDEIEGF